MAEIRIPGCADLTAVRLHREDVGAIDQPLVRVGIVGPNLFDQLILSKHRSKMGECSALVQARKKKRRTRGRMCAASGKPYWAARALAGCDLADALQRSRSAALIARP